MNKELEQNVSELLVFLKQGMTTAYDFSKQEVPLFIKEYLTWYYYEHLINGIFWLVLVLALAIAGFIVNKLSRKESKKALYDQSFPPELAFGFSICLWIAAIIFGGGIIDNVNACVKVKVAPRVVLMEEVKHLVK